VKGSSRQKGSGGQRESSRQRESASISLSPERRSFLLAGVATPVILMVQPVFATPSSMTEAIKEFTGGARLQSGRLTFEIAELIDNGNAVPVTIRVDSPMTDGDHVTTIGIFNERNPLPDVVRFSLTPRAGKAEVSTRIRLATSQKLVAVAGMSDGSWWQQTVDVVVTLAACIEGEVN
jgi:sulfur-oxidizing protein SoxY